VGRARTCKAHLLHACTKVRRLPEHGARLLLINKSLGSLSSRAKGKRSLVKNKMMLVMTKTAIGIPGPVTPMLERRCSSPRRRDAQPEVQV